MSTAILTRFAPAARKTPEEVRAQSRQVAQTPNVCALLDCFPVPAMILNQERQIVAANQKLASSVGRLPEALLGMRMGEAFRCIHSAEEPGGCGTSVFCRLCGGAKAMLGTWSDRVPNVQDCRLTCHSPQGWQALDLRVYASPLWIGPDQFTVVSLIDITDEKRRMVLEQMFFHDVLNSASGIRSILHVLPELSGAEAEKMLKMARDLADQLQDDICAGKELGAAERGELKANLRPLEVQPFLARICALYRHLPICGGKTIEQKCCPELITIISDESLLARIIGNLIKNALEASVPGQTVTVTFGNGEPPAFSVHNPAMMPEAVKLQMFQRSFSTKASHGRGIGTYSVKMLTERYLKGSVSFKSEANEGTTFTVMLPQPRAAEQNVPASQGLLPQQVH